MPKEKIEDVPLMRVCSVWLYFDGADYTRVKFWSQIICCTEKALKESMENVKYLATNKKQGVETEDTFLNLIYMQMKELTTEGMKVVFNGMRNKPL